MTTTRGQHIERSLGESGFTLIEVMIAVVYLTIGLLAIAAMQDIALSKNVDARRLTVATNAVTQMLERIRYNAPANSNSLVVPPIPGSQFLYHNIIACAAACALGGVTGVAPCPATFGNCNGPNAGNAAAQPTALGDFNQWSAQLIALDPSSGASLLPNAVGTVEAVPIGTAGLGLVQVTVTLQWTSGLRKPTVSMTTMVGPL